MKSVTWKRLQPPTGIDRPGFAVHRKAGNVSKHVCVGIPDVDQLTLGLSINPGTKVQAAEQGGKGGKDLEAFT